jgi:hypothetical protein
LQAISVGHSNGFGKVDKDVFTLIRGQANAAAMACIKIESEGAYRRFLRPKPSASMN